MAIDPTNPQSFKKDPIPKSKGVRGDVMRMANAGRAAIKDMMKNSRYNINLTSDIWTKRGFSSSYLGITAHFLDKDNK